MNHRFAPLHTVVDLFSGESARVAHAFSFCGYFVCLSTYNTCYVLATALVEVAATIPERCNPFWTR